MDFNYEYLKSDIDSIQRSLSNRLVYSIGKDPLTATDRDWFHTLAHVVRDRLIERWMETQRTYYYNDSKRIYYFSLEFLIGRTLENSMLNLGIYDVCKAALEKMGLNFEAITEGEHDAALGNGGLGRLAACFLDSLATLQMPAYGYGIRYDYGMFNQIITNGEQIEHPDNWLRDGNPWEFPRAEVSYPVHFYGRVVEFPAEDGTIHHHWIETEDVMAMAYDTPIPGYNTNTVNNMRLWSAKSTRDFDLQYFNEGNYIKAVEQKNQSENLSKVLYPDDTTEMGKELRLKQQYFFVSASLQDMLRRYQNYHKSMDELPDKVAIQLNDTHPAIAIPELMRILVDKLHIAWEKAWHITTRTFSYTNHTLLPEALERWDIDLFGKIFPRHLQIIYDINHYFLEQVIHTYPGDFDKLSRMSIIDEKGGKRIRMSHLAIVGSHSVNGVAELHTSLMKATIFHDFDLLYPTKIINMTNGITPRRWLNQANASLSQLLTETIGHEWTTDLYELKKIIPLADDSSFQEQFRNIKIANKQRLAHCIQKNLGINIDINSIFDVQIKRIHEYKRQLLNILHVITLYNRIRHNDNITIAPRTIIFSGKAAPGYYIAKLIIKLIHDIADVINNDPVIQNKLKVVFIPNYEVSQAEVIIPAADLSEQISTAGMEASGTGNMKLALNGALTIGTLDGANVEILEEVGENNIFIFGLTSHEVSLKRQNGYHPEQYYHANPELKQALDMIRDGFFCPKDINQFHPIVDILLKHGDYYMILADFESYIQCQDRISEVYQNKQEWTKRAILNTANMGKFSSDRTISEYAEKIWHIQPVPHQ